MEKILKASTSGKTTPDYFSTLWTCHCGGFALINKYCESDKDNPTQFQAECQTCGCCGAYGDCKEQAAFHWNMLADASFSRTRNVADAVYDHARDCKKSTHCTHCNKKIADGEGEFYEQGLLCNDCPDTETTVWVATAGDIKLYEKKFSTCCIAAEAWIKNDCDGSITLTQETMTVGEFYSLPECRG